MNAINWPLVMKLTLQGGAILVLTAGGAWAAGAEWQNALKMSVGTACGWLMGHLQREIGGVGLDLSALQKKGQP